MNHRLPDEIRLKHAYTIRLQDKDARILERIAHLQERTVHQVLRSAVSAYLRKVLPDETQQTARTTTK